MSSRTAFKVFKETSLPSSLVPNAVYMIAPSGSNKYLEIYVTSNDGTAHRHTIKESEIQSMIDDSIVKSVSYTVVNDISARDEISEPNGKVYVIDASDDSTVGSGGAEYLYHDGAWIKLSEAEGLDLSIAWSDIIGKPSSSIREIDAAVSNSHTHANKSTLDKFSEDDSGNVLFDGNLPVTGWQGDSMAW